MVTGAPVEAEAVPTGRLVLVMTAGAVVVGKTGALMNVDFVLGAIGVFGTLDFGVGVVDAVTGQMV